ncbi:MAG: transposase, partial [bacterium]
YRRIAIEEEVDGLLFGKLTDKLLKAFGVDSRKQRLDSTHIRSNMRELHRGEIFERVIEGFLRTLRRQDRGGFRKHVKRELVDRYLKRESCGCFSCVKPSEMKRTLEGMSEDLLWLVERFRGNKRVERMTSYRMLVRVLEEQCEVVGEASEAKRVQLKKASEVPSGSLQNPSDPDAAYDKHKGQGYQVQIMETYQEKEGEAGLDLITYVDVEPANRSDMDSLLPAVKSTEGRGCKPEELVADGGYGSDENVEKALKENVEVVAPANKGVSAEEERLHLDDFELDEETGRVLRCPAGEEPVKTGCTPKGNFTANFDREKCVVCELRDRCPVRIHAWSARLKAYPAKKMRLACRRAQEKTEEFREKYRWRAGVEATMSRYKSQTGVGRLRVRGMSAVRYAAKLKALGLNILRCARAVAEGAKTSFLNYFRRKSPVLNLNTWVLHLAVPMKIKTWFHTLSPLPRLVDDFLPRHQTWGRISLPKFGEGSGGVESDYRANL